MNDAVKRGSACGFNLSAGKTKDCLHYPSFLSARNLDGESIFGFCFNFFWSIVKDFLEAFLK